VASLRAFLILDRREHGTPTPLLCEVIAQLRERGIEVDWGVPEESAVPAGQLEPDYDLYLLKSYTDLGLSLAGVLHDHGARLLNPYPACQALRDKVATAWRLRAAGLPIPRTWSTGDPGLLADRLRDGPLIFKPARGVHGAGVRIVRDKRELAALREELSARSRLREPLVAQELVPGDGEDLKLYVSGEDVFGVRKAFSETSFHENGRPCRVSPEARELARRCGRAFGLTLYGLDVIEGPEGPVIVDVNYFPGYRGVPGAATRVVEQIERFACASRDGLRG
jgi:ribosomal protein S6--L-glutamate ligase